MTTVSTSAMSELRTFAEIESAALKLDAVERTELVKLVAGTIEDWDENSSEDDVQWVAEIERRVSEIRQGKVVGRNGETVMREALARFS